MKNILISGASVAGTTLAYWLGRYGFRVTVVERAPAPRAGGYAVDVRGTAIDVLARMGLLSEVQRHNCDTLGTSFLAANGKTAARMPRGFGVIDPNDIEVMRGDLVGILHRATQRDAQYIFADSITALEEHPDAMLVRFERSAPRKFDLVVGADGLHSNVRRLTFGPDAAFKLFLGSYMAIFTAPNHLQLDRRQLVLNLPGRVVSVKSDRGNREVKVFMFFPSPELEYDQRDLAVQKQFVRDGFEGAGWAIPRLLEFMRDAADFYFDATCQIRMPRWSRGRVTLVGDASSCPSPLAGQGSSMALVAAYVLAGELAAAAGDHTLALANYEARTHPFIEQNQDLSRALAGGFAPKSRLGILSRNWGMQALRFLPGSHLLLKWAMAGLERASHAIRLRDYREFEPGLRPAPPMQAPTAVA